jgi:hypothetical protein
VGLVATVVQWGEAVGWPLGEDEDHTAVGVLALRGVRHVPGARNSVRI